jgi:hypothetical protein
MEIDMKYLFIIFGVSFHYNIDAQNYKYHYQDKEICIVTIDSIPNYYAISGSISDSCGFNKVLILSEMNGYKCNVKLKVGRCYIMSLDAISKINHPYKANTTLNITHPNIIVESINLTPDANMPYESENLEGLCYKEVTLY